MPRDENCCQTTAFEVGGDLGMKEDPLQPAFGEHRLTDGLAVEGDREAIVSRVTAVGAPVWSVAMCQAFLPGA